MFQARQPGYKSHFILPGNDDSATLILSVEALAIAHYKKSEGWTCALHAEGAVFMTVYTLLFWDIIFGVEMPDVFRNVFQVSTQFDLYSFACTVFV